MSIKELEKLANEAIDYWSKESPALPGEPYIKVVNVHPMVPAFPIRWSCMAVQGVYYASFINAQDTLDYLASLESLEPKKILPEVGIFE